MLPLFREGGLRPPSLRGRPGENAPVWRLPYRKIRWARFPPDARAKTEEREALARTEPREHILPDPRRSASISSAISAALRLDFWLRLCRAVKSVAAFFPDKVSFPSKGLNRYQP